MGVVRSQGIKDSTVSYIGVAIGAINVIWVYPRFLTLEQQGIFQFLVSTAVILSPLMLMGASNLVIRYYPHFRNETRDDRALLTLLLLFPLLGAAALVLLGALARPWWEAALSSRDPLIRNYLPYVAPIALCLSVGMLLLNYAKNFMRFAVPSLLENPFVKLGSAAIAVLLFYRVYDLDGYIWGIVAVYGLMMLGQALYLFSIGELKLRRPTTLPAGVSLREMSAYGFYSILGSLGATMMTWLDKTMLPLLIAGKGTEALGIYAIMAYIGTVIDVPKRSLEKITAPLLAQAFAANDLPKIEELYRKTSLNQLIIGLLFFLGIWLNLDDLLRIMPNGRLYEEGRMVVLYLGLSALLDMVTGNNSQIILYSSYFRVNLYILLVLVAMNVAFNYLFVAVLNWHIEGAAVATLLAVGLFNLCKLGFIWGIWGMQPFTWAMLRALAIAGAIYIAVVLLPWPANPWWAMVLRSAFITLVYGALVWRLRLSIDINDAVAAIIARLRRGRP
jgi:O-antigen/teichoic acid export membrane protein